MQYVSPIATTLDFLNIFNMSKIIVEHEKYGKVLFDTETQMYDYYPERASTYFYLNNKREVYFNNVTTFLESNFNQAVIPFVCSEIGTKGKRTFCELIDWTNKPMVFFNVEMINSRWTPNKIENFRKHKSYFVIVLKNNMALNDFLILSAISIDEAKRKREMSAHLP
jgi:hypothetical protein